MNHRIGRNIFALGVGLAVAVFAFKWITNPQPRAERAQEELVVQVSRTLLASIVASDELEMVDPLAPDRKIGKVYVYAEGPGWAVSGYYRRNADDRWHPYLMTLSTALELFHLKARDPQLSSRASDDPRIEVIP